MYRKRSDYNRGSNVSTRKSTNKDKKPKKEQSNKKYRNKSEEVKY